MTHRRVPFPTDKRAWHPSLVPGPIALISTVDAAGAPNLAPKSFLQMVSFEPSILMFSGTAGNPTEANIAATGCFGVNLVDARLARRAFECLRWRGAERIARSGFALSPATAIAAPLLDEARAALECRLVETRTVGGALVVFGEIVAASILPSILEAAPRDRYPALGQALFLEEGLYAAVDQAHPAVPEPVAPHGIRFAYLLTPARAEGLDPALVAAHIDHLARLDDAGHLELCGPFSDGAGGIVVLRGLDEAGARAVAEADPFVTSGAETFVLRRLERASRDNGYLAVR